MARTRSIVIVCLAAAVAVTTALLLLLRVSHGGWDGVSRFFRNQMDHPDWELLAQ